MLTDKQKQIYNLYMSTSRKAFNQPYRYRQDFENFEKTHSQIISALQKIELLISKYRNLNLRLFFEAPYKLTKLSKPVGIEYFHSMKAIKLYHLYAAELEMMDPDSPEQLQFALDSLKFISSFCKMTNISIKEYPKYKKGLTYSWCKHFVEKNISFYAIAGFQYLGYNIYRLFNSIPEDEKELFFENFQGKINEIMTKLENSKKCKIFLQKGYKKICNDV